MHKAATVAASVKHNLSPATLHRRATIAAGGTAILGAVLTGYGLDLATQPQGDQSQLAHYDTDSILGVGLGGMLLGGAAEALLLGAYAQSRRETEFAVVQPHDQTPNPDQLLGLTLEG